MNKLKAYQNDFTSMNYSEKITCGKVKHFRKQLHAPGILKPVILMSSKLNAGIFQEASAQWHYYIRKN